MPGPVSPARIARGQDVAALVDRRTERVRGARHAGDPFAGTGVDEAPLAAGVGRHREPVPLAVPRHVPVIPCDARDRDSVKAVLIQLVKHSMISYRGVAV